MEKKLCKHRNLSSSPQHLSIKAEHDRAHLETPAGKWRQDGPWGSLFSVYSPSMSSRFREGFCLKNKVESARGRHNIDLSSTCTHRKLSGKRCGEDQKKRKKQRFRTASIHTHLRGYSSGPHHMLNTLGYIVRLQCKKKFCLQGPFITLSLCGRASLRVCTGFWEQ